LDLIHFKAAKINTIVYKKFVEKRLIFTFFCVYQMNHYFYTKY